VRGLPSSAAALLILISSPLVIVPSLLVGHALLIVRLVLPILMKPVYSWCSLWLHWQVLPRAQSLELTPLEEEMPRTRSALQPQEDGGDSVQPAPAATDPFPQVANASRLL
jgi:hypothetical protein